MSRIEPRTFKGTRDLLPEDMLVREKLISTMKSIFQIYGFSPLETPAVEFLEILIGKYGGDAEKLLYPLLYKDGKTLALRYDLTVPLARVIALHPHLPKPFKRYQIQPVWRADNPQLKRGRYREFYQCDVDTVGSEEMTADADIVALMIDVFDALKIENAEIRLNSRKILKGMVLGAGLPEGSEQDVCRIIDKLDKEGLVTVEKELLEKGFETRSVNTICDLLRQRIVGAQGLELIKSHISPTEVFEIGIEEISQILSITEETGISRDKVVFDFALARGLDYYTGPIFEVIVSDRPELGSLAGGGRYDDLVGLFSKNSTPAVGTSFGLERIFTLLKNEQAEKFEIGPCDVLVSFFEKTMRADYLRLLKTVRSAGIRAEMYLKPDKIKKQFAYADKKHIQFVLVYGTDEKESGRVTLKNLKTGEQGQHRLSELNAEIRTLLAKNN